MTMAIDFKARNYDPEEFKLPTMATNLLFRKKLVKMT